MLDAEVFEDDWDWATATVRVRSLTDVEDIAEPVVYEGLLRLPNGRLAIGDADSELTLNDSMSRLEFGYTRRASRTSVRWTFVST